MKSESEKDWTRNHHTVVVEPVPWSKLMQLAHELGYVNGFGVYAKKGSVTQLLLAVARGELRIVPAR